jgi:chromosome segregation protein
MTYVKRLVMKGFKSFVKKTELPFTPGINVVLGPNGSGKSNVSDALCFVLGRLSIKSMRATKAKNLIFMGSKAAGPAKEAVVEIVFDNSSQTFSIDSKEISLKRIVRKNGQSIYKINGDTKTRQEVLSLLAQAGIDPNGFNIVLQGGIQDFVKMHSEERRKVIEEVAGISIYEMRKSKSLKELEKTELRLKEVNAILRERTAYLNNLEKERQQALRFKKLEKDSKIFKKSILFYDLTKKKKASEEVQGRIDKIMKEIEKTKTSASKLKMEISTLESKISSINSEIQKQTGLQQEQLNKEITDIRAELAGLEAKKENNERKLSSLEKQKRELKSFLDENENLLKELQKESPTVLKNEKEREIKKKELEILEKERKKFYTTKSELKSARERIQDKTLLLQNYENESSFILKQIDKLSLEVFDFKTSGEILEKLKLTLQEKKEQLEKLNLREIELEKISHTNEHEIDNQKRIVEQISRIDICPVCKSKITEAHICTIKEEISPKVKNLEKEISEADKELSSLYNKRDLLKKDIEQLSEELSKRQSDIINISNIEGRKQQIKVLQEKIDAIKKELQELIKRRKSLEENFDENSNIDHRYETAQLEMQEISIRTKENVTSEISFKQKEVERARISLKQFSREKEDLEEEFSLIDKEIKNRLTILKTKQQLDEQLTKKCEKLIVDRENFQKKIREQETSLSNENNKIHNLEQETNNCKIERARFDAEIENLEIELLEFPDIEIIKAPKEALLSKLNKAQEILSSIGSVNLRSLEVYEEIKKEYDKVKEKVETISKEKEGIFRIIHEIDIKKKKAFLNTLNELNEIFSRNFAQISEKGTVTLEVENKKDPFESGVGIVVKTGHGKYFDVTSLSGGEQTMVALSLIFAIQELKPYYFYILDEIDAALDKRNSSRLAGLLKKYMERGQYIVITHNDEVISNATNLYGVSMHEGISKVVSMKV